MAFCVTYHMGEATGDNQTTEAAGRGAASSKRVPLARIAAGFAVAFLAGWASLCLVVLILCADRDIEFGWRTALLVGAAPFWFGGEPLWSAAFGGGPWVVDDAKMIALAGGLSMVASAVISIRTGRWIAISGSLMALYWIFSLMIVGLGF